MSKRPEKKLSVWRLKRATKHAYRTARRTGKTTWKQARARAFAFERGVAGEEVWP